MTEDQLAKLKFPIGPFEAKAEINSHQLKEFVNTIAESPIAYRDITRNLTPDDFKKTYRDGAWNIEQLVNHVADMQMLHFFRMKKALTESDYKEITLVNIQAWAVAPDSLGYPIADSLTMLEGITKRFVHLIHSLNNDQLEIAYYHPVRKVTLNQKQAVSMTAWHVAHHLEHIKIALKN
jgi:uncharacterized damage-inducible protein DinB